MLHLMYIFPTWALHRNKIIAYFPHGTVSHSGVQTRPERGCVTACLVTMGSLQCSTIVASKLGHSQRATSMKVTP